MASDPGRDRVVLSAVGGGTWTWDGADWTMHFERGSPPKRKEAAVAYDDKAGAILLFGSLRILVPSLLSELLQTARAVRGT